MQIKDYKCKCGHNDFFFVDKGSKKGIYCTYCGKWVKWADKDGQLKELGYEFGAKIEPCEDAIRRQAVLDYIYNDLGLGDEENGNDVERQMELDSSYRYIKSLPPVIPHQKTGHWIAKDGKEQGYDIAGIKTWYIQIMCSECGFIKTAIEGHTGHYKYCPNCGTKMQEEVWVNG